MGGRVAQRMEDLVEKAFMPNEQATSLAVSEYCAIAARRAKPEGEAPQAGQVAEGRCSKCGLSCGPGNCVYGERAAAPADLSTLERFNATHRGFEVHSQGELVYFDAVQELLATRTAAPAGLTEAARDVLAERRRQVEQEGWAPEQDDQYDGGELSLAASCYAVAGEGPHPPQFLAPRDWPWDYEWWKPTDDRRNLVKAGALILADIERLDRAQQADKA